MSVFKRILCTIYFFTVLLFGIFLTYVNTFNSLLASRRAFYVKADIMNCNSSFGAAN